MKTLAKLSCCIAVVALLVTCTVSATEGWWEEGSDGTIRELAEIVGSPAAWQISQDPHKTYPLVLPKVDGRRALTTRENRPLTLTGQTDFDSTTEYTVLFRLGEKGDLTLELGRKDPGDRKEKYISMRVRTLDDTAVNCSTTNLRIEDSRRQRTSMNYYVRGHKTRSLGWEESFRQRVEHQFGMLPRAGEKWLKLRVVASGDRVRFNIDDRQFGERQVPEEALSGKLVIRLTGSTAISSVRVRDHAVNTRFRPISIAGHLNTGELNGSAIAENSIPATGEEVVVAGIPFVFPVADANGNDHIDVGESWFKVGSLEGYYNVLYAGPFGGRWGGPMAVDPGRIQLSIPKEQVSRIHLIVAADNEKHSVPVVSAQFFRPGSGYPRSYAATVPSFTDNDSRLNALAVKLENGKQGNFYHITIDVDPGDLTDAAQMADSGGNMPYDGGAMAMELTKQVQLYRNYPDPICYSSHGGGLPSAVHVYAVTLEMPAVKLDLQPNRFGHVWTAPQKPGYTATLTNTSAKAREVKLLLQTSSHSGGEGTRQEKTVTIPANKSISVSFSLPLKRFGSHGLTLVMQDGEQTWTARRNLAYLHADTRARGDWQAGQGPIFGYWGYGGGHMTPTIMQTMEIMAAAGLETKGGSLAEKRYTPEVRTLAEKLGISTFKHFSAWDHYITSRYAKNLTTMKPEEADAKFLEELREHETKASAVTRTETISFFPEPHLGPITAGSWPSYYGEPEYQLTADEQKKLDYYMHAFLRGGALVKKHWPSAKLLLPHGNPLFAIPFLRQSPELAKLIDGVGVDSPNFERLPEMQFGQETIHRLYQLREEFKKVGKDPYLIFLEGNFVPTAEGALSLNEQADLVVRNTLAYYAYGIDRLATVICAYDAGNYYGEEHYGNGYVCGRLPLACPKPAYAAVATMTRHLNRANFIGPVTTGSTSVYCLQYKHYKTGDLMHALWTIRGKRPLSLTVGEKDKVQLFDADDNAVELKAVDGKVHFTIDSSPRYLRGLSTTPRITLGEPDHGDAVVGHYLKTLANPGEGKWRVSTDRDLTYENNHPLQMARFQGRMSVKSVAAPQRCGGQALAVHLEKQDKERKTMPWYTTLVPGRPITIPGKASHLGLWVKGASDWGRVVYSLRDAAGERWVSIGTREQWNVDDIHCWSKFCFDGWRYLRFEMPSSLPYDSYRENGSTWWGHFGKGDGIIDLPLQLEKIIVERRTHVMYVNKPVAADPADVLLGDLNAEYATPEDSGRGAVKLSRLRMPLPRGKARLENPIRDLAARGIGAPVTGLRVTDPLHHANGTQCDVHFEPLATAQHYDIWASPYTDGRGAMQLGKKWDSPGKRIRGLRPETDFYLFVVYTTKEGTTSPPSKPLKINLKDLFFQK